MGAGVAAVPPGSAEPVAFDEVDQSACSGRFTPEGTTRSTAPLSTDALDYLGSLDIAAWWPDGEGFARAVDQPLPEEHT